MTKTIETIRLKLGSSVAFLSALKKSGKIFSAEFVKKDNSVRKIHCRMAVKKHVIGKGLSYAPIDKGLIVVFDLDKMEYRMINLDTLLYIKCGKKIYLFN
jgi:hypothetical protein